MKKNFGPAMIMAAAGLWAVDALFRAKLATAIPSAAIVFFEHTLGFIFLLPLFWRSRGAYRALRARDWLVLVAMTIVSSVAGTLFFTEALSRSFALNDFATPVLLLKLQPIFVILLAAIFLRERLHVRFISLVPVALIGSYMISFGVEPVNIGWTGKITVVTLSLMATLCWGAGTILSKHVLRRLTFGQATAMRFGLAIPASLAAMFVFGQTYSPLALSGANFLRLIIIALITGGVGALLLYYRGLQRTEAKISTIAELVFPIVSIIIAVTALNPYGAAQHLTLANVFGVIILLTAIFIISFNQQIAERGT